MKYTSEIWNDRHRQRSDISTYLTHLTRGTEEKNSFEVLRDILTSQKLLGSTKDKGFIIGDNKAVCFQDMPLYGVAQNTLHEQKNKEKLGGKVRYKPLGLCFRKDYVFNKGGRPVFYEKKHLAKKILPKDEWWRIVSFDLSNKEEMIDWTHEREWRLKGDFEFELSEAIVIFPNKVNYSKFISDFDDLHKQVGGLVTLNPVLS